MDQLDELLGESPVVEALREQIRRLIGHQKTGGRRPPSILIEGETGTGKGLVARLIHRAGPRAGGHFVDVNCAAIPGPLLEAELFGFERGAFTDARRAKPGLFQTAHGGTIFLDEIGLLPEPLQAKLLTAMEEQAVRRLGATTSEPVNAWIICATNADLKTAIAERRFRVDLYHRLAVLTLRLPALRERGRDALFLAERFLARTCNDYGLPPKSLSDDAKRQLLAYPWPGNIRELSNVIERAALLEDSRLVTADTLGLSREAPPEPAPAAPAAGAPTLDRAMREHLLAVLNQTGWNLSRSASLLGIARNTLRARIRKHGLRSGAEADEPAPPAEPPSADLPAAAARPVRTAAPIRWEYRRITLLRVTFHAPDEAEPALDSSRALGAAIDKARTFGGRVEELSPTGMVASFGLDPGAEAPRGAAHAAMAIRLLAERARASERESFPLRMALHVAQVLVGRSGDHPQIDADAKRDHWRTLHTLLQAAAPDDIVVSATAAPFLERRFELVPVALAAEAMERAYRLTGHEKSGLEIWGQMGRFVGRRHELELLESRRAYSRAGHGQVVALVGDPGVGKSRLAWEFAHRESGDTMLLEARAVSYGTTTPYLPVIALLKAYFGIDPGDDARRIAERVGARVMRVDAGLARGIPALLALLDVPVEDPEWLGLDPPDRRQRTLETVRHLLLRQSRARPLLLVFEDLHWIDSETQALLDTLVEGLPTASLLLLVTYRPEYQHTWGAKSFYSQLPVDPLPPDSAAELLDALLGADAGLQPVKSLLIDWTDGNPFFLEESGRALVETEVLAGERGAYRLVKPVTSIQVPATVEEVLAARIDRLGPEDKRLLQSASVIGKDFSLSLLQAVVDLPEDEVRRTLARLHGADFLHEAGSFPKLEYTFRHALTHEVSYRSLFPDRRRALHARIVEAIERLFPDRLEEHTERLAHHALRGERWEQALTYLRQAGARAFARSANREAVTCFEQALTVLPHVPETRGRLEEAVDLRFNLRNALYPLGEFERILEHLREAESVADALGDRRRLGRVFVYMSQHFWWMGDPDRAIDSARRALGIALEVGDFPLQVIAKYFAGVVYSTLGEYGKAVEVLEWGVDALTGDLVYERFGLPGLPSVHFRIWLIQCFVERGEFSLALTHAEHGIRIAEAVSHPYSLAQVYFAMGFLHLRRGAFAEAVGVLERGIEVCRVWNIRIWMPRIASALGLALSLSGRPGEGVPLVEQAIEEATSLRTIGRHVLPMIWLGETYRLAERADAALPVARRALGLAREQKERGHEAWALRLLGDIAAGGQPADPRSAEEYYGEALTLAGERGMRPLLAHCHVGLGNLCRRAGEAARAGEHLKSAAGLFGEMHMQPWLDEVNRLLEA
ncbi:MAG TPA: sigma 54-interacting transcriptional regulator [Methylomirabilota bacterium]|nr:sigma 54-interacting transcriptional regulator [Methylomirabilota bacterium]